MDKDGVVHPSDNKKRDADSDINRAVRIALNVVERENATSWYN